MKRIEIFHAQPVPYRVVRNFAPQSFLDAMTESDHQTQIKTHFPGTDNKLSLLEIVEIPHAKSTVHSHEQDEIFYIVSGELNFGNQVCAAGDSIRILADTVYTFTAGDTGCRYVKFTATADHSFNLPQQK